MDLVNTIIESVTTIIAAIISVGFLSKIVKKTAQTYFFNYDNKGHDLHKIMRRAEKSIIVIAYCGDVFLTKYRKNLLKYMKKGINIKFAINDIENNIYMSKYTEEKDSADYTALETTLGILSELKDAYPDKLDIRVFHQLLTSSYVGIDLEQDVLNNKWLPNALLQIMSYQFHTIAKKSPITYISPQNKEQFQITVDSVFEIWDCSDSVDLDEFSETLIKARDSINEENVAV